MSDIRARVSDALRSRLEPVGPVAVKSLAAGIGRSGECVRKWLNEDAGIKCEDLAAIARYLKDPAILGEVFGDIGQEAREARLWFTDRGACHDAAAGFGEFVRRHLGLPLTVAGDMAVYGMKNLGWVEMTARGPIARARYHSKGIKAAAASGARGWLLEHADRLAGVDRAVLIGNEWAEAAGLSVAGVAAELALVAPAALKRMVERKRLDLLPASLGSIYRAWRGSPASVMDAAGAAGLGGRLNIFSAEGDAVSCQWIGPALPALLRDCIGSNVLGWSDPVYGAELRRACIEAREERATLTELVFPIFGHVTHFRRLALEVGGSIITVTERAS